MSRDPAQNRAHRADDLSARWRALGMVALAVVLSLAVGHKRGVAVGVVAFLVYGGIFLAPVLDRRGVIAWSQRHVVLDGLLLVPLLFLVIALATSLSLGLSIAIAIGGTLILMPLMVRLRGNTRA